MIPSMPLESDVGGRGGRGRGQRRRLIDDPRSLRALAHPLRLELLSLVGRAGHITAADAARELGVSHALASHHLRQLAKYGYVEQIDGADNRERPWQLVSTSHSWSGIEDKPGGAAAVAIVEQVAAERVLEQLVDWQERRQDWPAEWREHTGLGRSTVYLTRAETASLVEAIDALVADYVEQRPLDDLNSRPPGSVPVEITCIVIPREPTMAGT